MMALNPANDVPSHLRQNCDQLARRLRSDVARARAEGVGDRLGASQFTGRA
jgi:hypothetical protein